MRFPIRPGEVHAGWGNSEKIAVVGLPDTAVKESKDPVISAICNSALRWPGGQRITEFLRGEFVPGPVRSCNGWSKVPSWESEMDFAEVEGEQHVKRAIEVAAGGLRNILTLGSYS